MAVKIQVKAYQVHLSIPIGTELSNMNPREDNDNSTVDNIMEDDIIRLSIQVFSIPFPPYSSGGFGQEGSRCHMIPL